MAVIALDNHQQRTNAPDLPMSWIRPRQFSEVTGMSLRATYNELYAGRLRGVQVGASWFIRIEEVESYFKRHGQHGKRISA